MSPAVISIVILVVAVVLFLSFYLLLKGILRAFSAVSLLLIIVLALAGFFIITDANEFQQRFPTEQSLYLLEDNGDVLAAFAGFTEITTVSAEEVKEYSDLLRSGDLKALHGENYKLFVIPLSWLDASGSIDLGIIEIPSTLVVSFIKSKDPIGEFSSQLALLGVRVDSLEVAQTLKTQMFTALLAIRLGNEGMIPLLDGYREDEVIIYPETSLFAFIKNTPE